MKRRASCLAGGVLAAVLVPHALPGAGMPWGYASLVPRADVRSAAGGQPLRGHGLSGPRPHGGGVAASSDATAKRSVAKIGVTRATLKNGLQVVVLRDSLAPVATVVTNYEVGADDEPIPGLAHAQEHMMFRGSKTVSAAQFAEVTALTGGSFDADTQNEITQFFYTVPSGDLEAVLHLEASRAQGILDSQRLWNEERGAIEQEVRQDNSSAGYRLYVKMLKNLLADTPYSDPGLGTIQAFSRQINAPQLKAFYAKWYHPNNAIMVIAGDVDPQATIAQVQALFGPIPAQPLPPRPKVRLGRLHPKTFTDVSSSPETQVFLAYRFPGYDSPDWAASQVLLDVLNSKRASLYKLVADGRAFDAGAQGQTYPKAGLVILELDVAPSTPPQTALAELQQVVNGYLRGGVPADLVAAAKLREASEDQFAADSIPGLAQEWSQALAVEHRTPDADLAAIERVTSADVDRVARTYLGVAPTKAYAVPKNTGAVGAGPTGKAPENNTIVPSKREPLPAWARSLLTGLHVPKDTTHPVVRTLPNGLRLIVQPESLTHTVVLRGAIKTAPDIEEKPGREGVASLASTLLGYGTTRYDRLAYQRQLDEIAAEVSTGASFGLNVTTPHFDRGVQLLADAELHPALRPRDFQIAKQQEYDEVVSAEKSPDQLTRISLVDALYPKDDPARRHPTPQSVQGLTLGDVRNWYATAYRPDLTTIVVVGDVTPAQALRVVERWFGGWKAQGAKPNLYPSPVPNNAPKSVTVPAAGRVQDTVILSQTLRLTRADPDVPALRVANAALTGGFYASILFHDLRETTGLVYAVNSGFEFGRTRSTFNVVYGASPQNVARADSVITADLKRMQTAPLSTSQLQVAKALLLGQVATERQSYDGIAGQFLSDASEGLPLDYELRQARRELAATPQDVRTAMARWVRPDGFAQVIEGPSP
jgi:zinc protease